eukprot:2065383-Alexandrium_andersonii.AAC.1
MLRVARRPAVHHQRETKTHNATWARADRWFGKALGPAHATAGVPSQIGAPATRPVLSCFRS